LKTAKSLGNLLVPPGESFKDKIGLDELPILDINERQKKALEYLQNKGMITRRKYLDITNVSTRTANNELKELVEKGLILRKGKGRAVHYILRELHD